MNQPPASTTTAATAAAAAAAVVTTTTTSAIERVFSFGELSCITFASSHNGTSTTTDDDDYYDSTEHDDDDDDDSDGGDDALYGDERQHHENDGKGEDQPHDDGGDDENRQQQRRDDDGLLGVPVVEDKQKQNNNNNTNSSSSSNNNNNSRNNNNNKNNMKSTRAETQRHRVHHHRRRHRRAKGTARRQDGGSGGERPGPPRGRSGSFGASGGGGAGSTVTSSPEVKVFRRALHVAERALQPDLADVLRLSRRGGGGVRGSSNGGSSILFEYDEERSMKSEMRRLSYAEQSVRDELVAFEHLMNQYHPHPPNPNSSCAGSAVVVDDDRGCCGLDPGEEEEQVEVEEAGRSSSSRHYPFRRMASTGDATNTTITSSYTTATDDGGCSEVVAVEGVPQSVCGKDPNPSWTAAGPCGRRGAVPPPPSPNNNNNNNNNDDDDDDDVQGDPIRVISNKREQQQQQQQQQPTNTMPPTIITIVDHTTTSCTNHHKIRPKESMPRPTSTETEGNIAVACTKANVPRTAKDRQPHAGSSCTALEGRDGDRDSRLMRHALSASDPDDNDECRSPQNGNDATTQGSSGGQDQTVNDDDEDNDNDEHSHTIGRDPSIRLSPQDVHDIDPEHAGVAMMVSDLHDDDHTTLNATSSSFSEELDPTNDEDEDDDDAEEQSTSESSELEDYPPVQYLAEGDVWDAGQDSADAAAAILDEIDDDDVIYYFAQRSRGAAIVQHPTADGNRGSTPDKRESPTSALMISPWTRYSRTGQSSILETDPAWQQRQQLHQYQQQGLVHGNLHTFRHRNWVLNSNLAAQLYLVHHQRARRHQSSASSSLLPAWLQVQYFQRQRLHNNCRIVSPPYNLNLQMPIMGSKFSISGPGHSGINVDGGTHTGGSHLNQHQMLTLMMMPLSVPSLPPPSNAVVGNTSGVDHKEMGQNSDRQHDTKLGAVLASASSSPVQFAKITTLPTADHVPHASAPPSPAYVPPASLSFLPIDPELDELDNEDDSTTYIDTDADSVSVTSSLEP